MSLQIGVIYFHMKEEQGHDDVDYVPSIFSHRAQPEKKTLKGQN